MSTSIKRALRFALVAIFVTMLSVAGAQPSPAQFTLPEDLGLSSGLNPPTEVTRLGSIEVAPVHSPISGEELFRVASPTIYDRNAEGVDMTAAVERRAEEVNARLRRAIIERTQPRRMNPDTLAVGVAALNGGTVITATDDTYTQPLVLVTVTEVDASYHGIPIDKLAEEWRGTLAKEIRTGLQQLTPEELTKDVVASSRTLVALLVITGLFLVTKHLVKRYQRRLYRRKKALSTPPEPEPTDDPQAGDPPVTPDAEPEERVVQRRHYFLQAFDELLTLERRLSLLSFIQWALFWVLILIWYIGLYRLFRQVPYLEQYSQGVLQTPIEILVIWFFTGLAIRICRRLIDRFTTEREGFDLGDVLTFGDAQRRQLRASTIAGAAKGLLTIVLLGLGLLLALDTLGLPTGSILAIGSIFALAISFGSQSLVKDLVNGFLILAEDQFAIGDVVDIGNASGLVENLNLRVTQLRSVDGELITTPNSNITQVKNLTRSWSRVAFSIDVAYKTDPDQALNVLKAVASSLYNDPEWHDKIVAEPTVLGIDSVSHTGMTITIWIQTLPAQQWTVGREFRLRVRRAMGAHGIDIGTPRQTFEMESPQDANGAPQSLAESGG